MSQIKISAAKALVIGLTKKAATKKAFDWTRLLPWIPLLSDPRRRGTGAEMRSPAHKQVIHNTLAPIYKREDTERALGTRRAAIAHSAGAGSANL